MQISTEEVTRLLESAGIDMNGKRKGRPSRVLSSTPASTSPSAQVELSHLAHDVHVVRKEMDLLPEVRADRVQALRAQIQDGSYKVSSQDIADLMIRRTLADNTAG